MTIQQRLRQVNAQLDEFTSKARVKMEGEPLIITLVAGINPNAPEGTEIDGETTSFVWPTVA